MKMTYIVIVDCEEGAVKPFEGILGISAILDQVADIPGVKYVETYESDSRRDNSPGDYKEIRVPCRQMGGTPGRG